MPSDSDSTAGAFSEDALRPISALQHLLFCERQCALIHIEQQWADNVLTVEGSLLHRRVDASGPRLESRDGLRIARGLGLRSLRLGLVGVADAVELHRDPNGVKLPGLRGTWRPSPVEYKRGKPKRDDSDRVQLCAQALCLEEMLGATILEGALYYGKTRRREAVAFDSVLRQTTETAARRLHDLLDSRRTPSARREPKCNRCSLLELCLPDLPNASVETYLSGIGTEPAT